MRAEPRRRARPSAWLPLACAWAWASLCTTGSVMGSATGYAAGQVAPIRVGSKNFPESRLLGEMMAQLIEARTGLEVEHRSGLGGTLICFEALKRGEIDLYPEYTGTAWAALLKETETVVDPMRAYFHVQSECRRRFDLEWLAPFGLNDTYALAMSADKARELGVETISDLVPLAGQLSAGFSFEFLERADGYPGLARHYGLSFERALSLEHGLAYEAVREGSIDLLDAYSTDAKLLRFGLKVLEDDRHFFPPYHAAPLMNGSSFRARPEVARALEELAFRIDDARMIRLNHGVEVLGHEFPEAARAALVELGLLQVDPSAPSAATPAAAREGFLAFFAARLDVTLELCRQHLALALGAVLLAALIAIPLGIAITTQPWAARLSLGLAGVAQTIPSLALLAFMIAVPGLGLSTRSALAALTLYALLPILRNTFTGLIEVDPELIDAARGLGLTERQILLRIQLPLATRTIMAGVRTATVVSIGFATLAAFIGAGGLGEPILTGLYLNDPRLILAGALPAALLALLADFALGWLERAWTPRGLTIS